MPFVYLNGQFIEEDSASVSVADRGLLLGDGLFETMRAYGGVAFRPGAHLERLRASARFLHMPFDMPDDDVRAAIRELIERNESPDATLRLTVTRGPMPGLRLDGACEPTILLTAKPLRQYPAECTRRGCDLVISTHRRYSGSPLARHKTTNYLLSLLARREAADSGAHGALILNETGAVAEESVSNVFFVRDDTLVTPPPHCGLLPGITRAVVLEIAAEEGIPVAERPVSAGEIFECGEMFLTNSLMEVMPVRKVDRRRIGAEAPGPITRRLRQRYSDCVKRETSGQAGPA